LSDSIEAKFLPEFEQMKQEIGKVFFGQEQVVSEVLIALISGGHVLLEGVPGLGKTLLVKTLAQVTGLSTSRIQCTPDLMPMDITGSTILKEDHASGETSFVVSEGPIFANLILADEINRTPPKTQAALLQAMQEHEVTIYRETHKLPEPFFVMATQNPIEQEGTYPLPEAELDRFMFNTLISYPDEAEEIFIAESTTHQPATEENVTEFSTTPPVVEPSTEMNAEILRQLQRRVLAMGGTEEISRYAASIVRASRIGLPSEAEVAREYLAWGAGPRATQALILGAKARAMLMGYDTPANEDVDALVRPVLRHRLVTNFRAAVDGISKDDIIERLLAEVGS